MKRDGINPGGTHFPILAAAVARTWGDVLELGIGDYSTPMLHHMLARSSKHLVSLETSEEWLELFAHFRSLNHELNLMKRWEDVAVGHNWGVVFVDVAPGDARPGLAAAFKDTAHFVVCHDTEAYGDGWDKIKGVFRHETVWKEYPTWTTVYSNFEEFKL